jgi:hypothetical protein
MAARVFVVVVAAAVGLLAGVAGCGESTSEGQPSDAGDEAREAGPIDPHCRDGMQLKERPKGPCVTGASCAVLVEPQICADGKWPPAASPKQWYCACPASEWECTDNGALVVYLCEGGVPADAGSDGPGDASAADAGDDGNAEDAGSDAPDDGATADTGSDAAKDG